VDANLTSAELHQFLAERLQVKIRLVLQDPDSDSTNTKKSSNQTDKQLSSFVILEGQKYRTECFESTTALLACLADTISDRSENFALLNSQNERKFGESDKQMQSLISAINQRNYQLFEAIISQQQNQNSSVND